MRHISRNASSLELPHVSVEGLKSEQTAGRVPRPNWEHSPSGVRLMQRTPAGLPAGMPGISLLMESASQQAPHFLHSMSTSNLPFSGRLRHHNTVLNAVAFGAV